MNADTTVRSEDRATYTAVPTPGTPEYENILIENAIRILGARLAKPDAYISCPEDASKLAVLKLANRQAESFCVMWLSSRNGMLTFEELFQGTIDGASVPPREVVRRALDINAAACILVHNHPSTYAEPSEADKRITARLKEALALIDTRVLDHLIVGGTETYSFSEQGML